MKTCLPIHLLRLTLLFILVLLLPPSTLHANSGRITCAYEFTSYLSPVDDLHLDIRMMSDTRIVTVHSIDSSPDGVESGIVDLDQRGIHVDVAWDMCLVPGVTVRVAITMTVDGVVCSNTQALVGSFWTYQGSPASDTVLPGHAWFVFPRDIGGETDIHPFRLQNLHSAPVYVRNLEFHYGNTAIYGLDLIENPPVWMGDLYTGGDFGIPVVDSMMHDIVVPHTTEPVHIHGHYEFWTGSGTSDSLLGECWFHHYDFEEIVEVEEEPPFSPAIRLHTSYPNPFNPQARIEYELPVDCHARIEIYDLLGRRIANLRDGPHKQGRGSVTWQGFGRWGVSGRCLPLSADRRRFHRGQEDDVAAIASLPPGRRDAARLYR